MVCTHMVSLRSHRHSQSEIGREFTEKILSVELQQIFPKIDFE